MKLNHDCIRSVMLAIESNLFLDIPLEASELEELTSGYSNETILYTLLKLEEAGYINLGKSLERNRLSHFDIECITWDGHIFLDTVRDNKVWSQTKKAVSTLSSVSVPILQQIASDRLLKLISGSNLP
nr:DUF2513 domain-containing protein [Enterococcus innesii]